MTTNFDEDLYELEDSKNILAIVQKYHSENESEKDRDEFMDEIKTHFKDEVDPFDEMDPKERKRKISRMIDNYLSDNGY